MTRLHAYYRPEIQRALEAEPKPNPWQDIRLHPEPRVRAPWPRTLPRRARIALKWAIGIILAWWVLAWAAALVGGAL